MSLERPNTMDLDTAYIDPLVHHWLDHLQETTKEVEEMINRMDEFYLPFVAIPVPVINAIFKITERLELETRVKYIAIHLYDKFMCNYFWEVYKAELAAGPTEESWSQVCKKISSQSKLYLMSCLQIASKMESHSKGLAISQVLNVLRWIDRKREYTRSMVLISEMKVFKMVGYRIPLCTPLHCIEVLLAATGLKEMPSIQEVSVNLLDLTYLQREKLFTHLQCLLNGRMAKTELEKRSLMALETNVLFLSASIILCATFFLCLQDEMERGIASKLAHLVGIQDTDLLDMANILLVMAIQK